MVSMMQNLLMMIEVSYQMSNIAQSYLNCHRSNAFQKENDVIRDIVHDRGHMRTHCVIGQQHAKNLRRNKAANVAEMM